MVKNGLLGGVAIVLEDGFLGAATGTAHALTGLREFDPSDEFGPRTIKTNVWRQASSAAAPNIHWRGRLDVEACPCESLDFLLGLLLEGSGAPIDTDTLNTYRPRRAGDARYGSAKFRSFFEGGPWVEHSGVVIEAIRITVRAGDICHVSADWVAVGRSEVDSDPAWTSQTTQHDPMPASGAVLDVNGGTFEQGIECSMEFNQPIRATLEGTGWKLSRSAPMQITGSFTEFFEAGENLPSQVRGQSEFSLHLKLFDSAGRYLEVTLPRCMPSSGSPSPIGQDDVTDSIAFQVLSFSEDEGNDPTIKLVTPGGGS